MGALYNGAAACGANRSGTVQWDVQWALGTPGTGTSWPAQDPPLVAVAAWLCLALPGSGRLPGWLWLVLPVSGWPCIAWSLNLNLKFDTNCDPNRHSDSNHNLSFKLSRTLNLNINFNLNLSLNLHSNFKWA